MSKCYFRDIAIRALLHKITSIKWIIVIAREHLVELLKTESSAVVVVKNFEKRLGKHPVLQ